MKVEYNSINDTLAITNISAKEASLISLAFKSPIVLAAIGKPLIDEFNQLKERAQNAKKS